MGLGGLVLGSPILYLMGMRILLFQLSGFYYRTPRIQHFDRQPGEPGLVLHAIGPEDLSIMSLVMVVVVMTFRTVPTYRIMSILQHNLKGMARQRETERT